VGQFAWSHHLIEAGGRLVRHSAPYRYVWPSGLVLMDRIPGFRLRERWAGWDPGRRSPSTAGAARSVREPAVRTGAEHLLASGPKKEVRQVSALGRLPGAATSARRRTSRPRRVGARVKIQLLPREQHPARECEDE